MPLIVQVSTIHGDYYEAPITLKVMAEWERWSGKSIKAFADPTAYDLGYIAWRASLSGKYINKKMKFDQFISIVTGWDIHHYEANAVQQIEDWLQEQ
jgi:hypothetical protein